MDSIEILARLVGFPTISSSSNLGLVGFAADLLSSHGFAVRVIPEAEGRKASLLASAGPDNVPGILLSGHTDVVPVADQNWSSDPFNLVERDGRFYGRGAADMKGFIACALAAALKIGSFKLSAPLQIALSYDEEIGCVGVRPLLDLLQELGVKPRICLIGEPTSMRVVVAHKGKFSARAICSGTASHSASAPLAQNAIHLAVDFIERLRARQQEISVTGVRELGYVIPYTTIHVGHISGGLALNIVPEYCAVDFEVRNVAAHSSEVILDEIRKDAALIRDAARNRFPAADIQVEVINTYPGLATRSDSEPVMLLNSILGGSGVTKVAFGTEAGLYANRLGVSAVVCGPGSMDQGHIADEFISRAQIEHCDAMLSSLIAHIAA